MGIYVNQLGYLPNTRKIAAATFPCNFKIVDTVKKQIVFEGTALDKGMDESSGDHMYELDFSALNTPGSYRIEAENGACSHPFRIAADVYSSLKSALIKALYYQRCGCDLPEEYAGVYTHDACHMDGAIFLQDYLDQKENPKTYDMTGGWHDAGDFGRYSSPAAVALAHLLYAYELFPEALQMSLNIPESDNEFPDILNECLYELTWLLKMQDSDGGVYHKLTSFSHADFVMPEEDRAQFLIYPVSSMATADFAAVMALAARVFTNYYPDFAKKALDSARKAWAWLEAHPYVGFHNPEGSNTGEYDDDCDLDERLWASAELLRTDRAVSTYAERFFEYSGASLTKTDFGWTDVSGLASLCVLTDPEHHAGRLEESYRNTVLAEADRLLAIQEKSGYRLAMLPEDFVWGSNMVVCNRSMLFILAGLICKEKKSLYAGAALEQLHYLLGRNALDISYVTGFGEHAFRNPHNRPTFADGIDLPMPGWVSGGPYKAPCDPAAIAAIPKGTPPMKCYVDDVGSYSTNEITIYWNSPAVFMTAFFSTLSSFKK